MLHLVLCAGPLPVSQQAALSVIKHIVEGKTGGKASLLAARVPTSKGEQAADCRGPPKMRWFARQCDVWFVWG